MRMLFLFFVVLAYLPYSFEIEAEESKGTSLSQTQKEAIEAIKKLDGQVEIGQAGQVFRVSIYRVMSDADLEHLERLTDMKHLTIRGNFTNDGLEHITGLKKLDTLSLTGPLLGDSGLAHLKNLKNLGFLHVAGKITDAGLAQLKGMASLNRLEIGSNDFTDAGLVHLKGLKNLQSLGFETTGSFNGEGFAHLKEMKDLQNIAIWGKMGDSCLTHLIELRNVQRLTLASNNFTNEGLAHLQELKNLQELTLLRGQFTDAGLENLKEIQSLRKLSLYGKFTEEGVKNLQTVLPECEIRFRPR